MTSLLLEYSSGRSGATSSTPGGTDLCLLLVGKTGHGKSASGNSILGERRFKTALASESVTESAEIGYREVDGRKLTVVDTQGLEDTRLDTEESVKSAMESFNKGVSCCPDGFHAIILVFDVNFRITKEEEIAIGKLKEMLGKNVIKEYGVLLFTHGDNFDQEEVQMTFKDWSRSRLGFMGDLVEECGNRCVLFNNRTKDIAEKARQRQELVDCVDRLPSRGIRYTNFLFDKAKETWLTLNRQRKNAKVINEVNAVLGDVSSGILIAQERGCEMGDAFFDGLRGKLRDVMGHVTDMEGPERGDMEGQIMQMDKRISHTKEKQGNEELMLAELNELRKQTEDMKQKHMDQMKLYQGDFVKAQEQMFGKLMEMVQQGMNQQMQAAGQAMNAMGGRGGGGLVLSFSGTITPSCTIQ